MFAGDMPSALKEDVYEHYIGYIDESLCSQNRRKEQIFMKMLMKFILQINNVEGREMKMERM